MAYPGLQDCSTWNGATCAAVLLDRCRTQGWCQLGKLVMRVHWVLLQGICCTQGMAGQKHAYLLLMSHCLPSSPGFV